MRLIVRSAVNRAIDRMRRPMQRPAEPGRMVVRPGVDLAAHWARTAEYLLRFGGTSSGNEVQVFCGGDDAFDAIWSAIDSARRRVWVETYIMEPDRVGRRTVEALTNAARRGGEVILLYDGVGGGPMTDEVLQPLRDAGGRIEVFNPVRLLRGTKIFRRNHRKIVIVDDDLAFCGGMNMSEEYAGPKYGNGRFQDCHLGLRGPCVADLAGVFLNSMRMATGARKRSLRRRWKIRRKRTRRSHFAAAPIFVQVLASSGWGGRRAIQRAIRYTLRRAVHQCFITTPYFVPPQRIVRAITKAAQRGVDVQILTAGVSDVPIVRAAAQHIYGEFLTKGVRIFEIYDTTLHAKTLAIDGLYSTVGTFNLDTWSDRRNLEVNISMIDADVTRLVQGQFLDSLERAREVTLQTWGRRSYWQRFLHWLAYQMMRL